MVCLYRDLSQFLAYAALNKDRRLYTPLRDFAVALDFDNSSDPYTWGLSHWEGSSPDASGTTEALLGSKAFGW